MPKFVTSKLQLTLALPLLLGEPGQLVFGPQSSSLLKLQTLLSFVSFPPLTGFSYPNILKNNSSEK